MLNRIFPFLIWFNNYNGAKLWNDFIAGLNVALVLVPQSMAYAQLAGLPVYYGLYAAFLPPMVAALFGSSNQLATGPVAIVSLMTATALEPLAVQGSDGYVAYAILLALLVGLFQFTLGLLRLGILVNFLSHPVVIGFTNAAAIIIATSQLSKLFGVDVDKGHYHYETVIRIIKAAINYTHWPTFFMAVLAISMMVFLRKLLPKIPNVLAAVAFTTFLSWSMGFEKYESVNINQISSPEIINAISNFNESIEKVDFFSKQRAELSPVIRKAEKENGIHSTEVIKLHHDASLINLNISEWGEKVEYYRFVLRHYNFESGIDNNDKITFYILNTLPDNLKNEGKLWRLKVNNRKLDESALKFICGGAVVGVIPEGLPQFKIPKVDFSIFFQLFPVAVIISLLGFMEAISIAKAMAAKTGQRLDPNQELIGQGLSNMIGSFGQSYPVSGSFSRSAVNIQSGAKTGLSSVFTSFFVFIVLLFFTPFLYHLPQSVLASIIIMAVIRLIDIPGMARAWRTQRYDGAIAGISFACTLGFAPHLGKGIIIGVFLSLAVFFYRHMRPSVGFLSKHPDGSFRDVNRWGLNQCRYIAVIRFNGSLFFADASYLENRVLEKISYMQDLRHVLFVGNAINEMDASGEDMISSLFDKLKVAGYEVSFSGLNDDIIDIMRRTHLLDKIGDDHMFRNVRDALKAIHAKAHYESIEKECPLLITCSNYTVASTANGKSTFLARLMPSISHGSKQK